MQNRLNQYSLTFDTDWASNEALEFVYNILVKNNIKSNWFITHDFPLLKELKRNTDLFELGIHPNFLEGSTQGNTEDEIIENLLTLIPNCKIVRAHSVFQYGKLLSKYVSKYKITIDSGIFLPKYENIEVVEHLTPEGILFRIPIYWADDYELLISNSKWSSMEYNNENGLKVLLFHPIHVYLNTSSHLEYEKLKNSTVENIDYSKRGVYSLFEEFTNNKENNFKFISELI